MKNDKGMNLLDIQDTLATAYQLDLEQGVAWMNEEYSAEWQKLNPRITDAIMQILDLDAEAAGPLQVYHEIDWDSED